MKKKSITIELPEMEWDRMMESLNEALDLLDDSTKWNSGVHMDEDKSIKFEAISNKIDDVIKYLKLNNHIIYKEKNEE